MKRLKIWWCELNHWGKEKHVIEFYSNHSHKYKCDKCKHEYSD